MKVLKNPQVLQDDSRRVSPISLLPYFLRPNGCWECALKDDAGGGYKRVERKGRRWRAHRWQWVCWFGPLLPGEWVLHKCDNPPCINPDHLFLGDVQANVTDMHSKRRGAKHEKHSSAKLTWKQIELIRASRDPGPVLATRFGCSVMNISKIRRGLTWV